MATSSEDAGRAPTIESFGTLLRRHRLAAGFSQERLAELAAVSTDAVGALERGSRKAPQRQTLRLLLDALALDPHDRAALTLAAVRPSTPRLRGPRPGASKGSALFLPPAELTSFVGRDAELAKLLSLCKAARMTTIVGPGGVGKTRLALELARRAASLFDDRVAVVPLAAVLPGETVVAAVASALGVHDDGTLPLDEHIAATIGDQRILVIFDNCEHVLDELAPRAHRWLAGCPQLCIVATSRERLGVEGEHIFRLRPLSLDDAVDVFIDRAAANGFDTGERADDQRVVAEICDRLDRMPLAIELAASCSTMLALEGILARLREHAALPASTRRLSLPQHRSLDAVVDWSYSRLDPNDAMVFRQFALFAGGARLDDAQAILGAGRLESDDVVYSLFHLHEQSLIDADRADIPRFQMLQTIREFADARLMADERSAVRHRFAAHYCGMVAALDASIRDNRQNAAIARISNDWTNVRSALANLAPDSEIAEIGLTALGVLSHHFLRVGTLTEGAEIFAAIDFARFPHSRGLANALAGVAFLELCRHQYPRAHAFAVQARAVARATGEPWFDIYAGITEYTAAYLSRTLSPEPFEPLYARAIEIGDPWLIGAAASCMATLIDPEDRPARAKYLVVGLANVQESGDTFAIKSMSLALARCTVRDEPLRALEYIMAIWDPLDPPQAGFRAYCVECFAEIAERLGRLDDAAFLLGAAMSDSRLSGTADPARAWLEGLKQRLGPARATLAADGERASRDRTNERVAAFVRRARS